MEKRYLFPRARTILSKNPNIGLAYLFGSQVDGKIGPLSDIDLAVLFTDEGDPVENCTKLAYEIGKELKPYPIEIISLRESPVELAYAIISQVDSSPL